MIQRIQSVFLLLAALAFLAQFGCDMASSSDTADGFLSDKAYNIMDHPILIGMIGLGSILALVSIFLYTNRPTQRRVAILALVVAILFPAVSYWLFAIDTGDITQDIAIDDELGTYLPFSAVILTILAIFYINKDEQLVQSSNRLR